MSAKTNATTFAYGAEPTYKADPSEWKVLEPNTISTFGSTVSKVSRNPISPNRQNRKSAISDVDSAVNMEFDLTMDAFEDFIDGLMFANFQAGPTVATSTAVSATEYTIDAIGTTIPNGTLVNASGFTNPENNGLKIVTGGSLTTIEVAGLVLEASPPSGAKVEVAGVQGASGDLEIDASENLISTALDFTTLGLTVGQMIFIGGLSTDAALNFGDAANRGLVRVRAITANEIVLDKLPNDFVVDDGLGQTVQLFFGRYITNVAVDDANYAEKSYMFEGGYGFTPREYEYPLGNFANSMTLNLALSSKATFTMDFIGADSALPSATRKAGAAAATLPSKTEPFNTSTDFGRLRVQSADETGLTSCLKDIALTISNNVSPDKCIGQIGAVEMNVGNFAVSLTTQTVFTNTRAVTAIRNNETVSMDFFVKNADGGIAFDVSSMSLGDGSKAFDINESVKINLTGEAFADETFNNSLGVSLFPHVPA